MTKHDKLDSSYELGATLGKGTYSEVLRAKRKPGSDDQSESTDDDSLASSASPDVVAIKRISKSRLITSEERSMPQREIEIHGTIGRHPNAVYMFDSYEDDESVFLVLEMVEGGTLEEKLKHNPLGLQMDQAKNIVLQLLRAVEHLHDRSLVHVDISPKNILIDEKTGTVKLCDFGMAQISRTGSSSSIISSSSSESAGVYGTHGYAAPEVSAGTHVDVKADMWSLGMVCYELLTGLSPGAILASTEITYPDELWNGKSSLAVDFTKSLLRINTCERPSIGAALAHPWFREVA